MRGFRTKKGKNIRYYKFAYQRSTIIIQIRFIESILCFDAMTMMLFKDTFSKGASKKIGPPENWGTLSVYDPSLQEYNKWKLCRYLYDKRRL